MQSLKVLRHFVLGKLAKAPVLCLELSALDVFIICQALLVWLAIHPGNKIAENLKKKLQNILFNLLPNCRDEITSLLTIGVSKHYGNSKTNSQA